MLRKRLISATVALLIAFFAFWFGEPWFTAMVVVGAVLAGREFYRLVFPSSAFKSPLIIGSTFAVVLILARHIQSPQTLPLVTTACVIVSLTWFVLRRQYDAAFLSWAWTIAGAVYIGWLLGYWVLLRALPDGRFWASLVILGTIASDSAAFFVGRSLGKHKMAPSLSPHKTWEGAVGGTLGAILVCLILNMLFSSPTEYVTAAILGLLISAFAQTGDLVVSLLKRNAGVKDTGNIMPGHGGILDRIGSAIISGAAIYYLITWIAL